MSQTTIGTPKITLQVTYTEKKVCWINKLGGCGVPLSYYILLSERYT